MTTISLLIARNFEAADREAVGEWKWQRASEAFGRYDYRRPDRAREIIRWLPDRRDQMNGLAWCTKVYLVPGWELRDTADHIRHCIDTGFFIEENPVLPAPRSRRDKNAETLAMLKKSLEVLEKRR